MALSGSQTLAVSSHWFLDLEWTATQSIVNNTSTITAKLYWRADGYGAVSSSSTKTCSITIDGGTASVKTASGLASLSGGQKKLIHTFTKTVTHASDGTNSIVVSGYFDMDVTLGGVYCSAKTVTDANTALNTIPRESTLTSSESWTFPANLPITISRASTSFDHDIEVFVNGVSVASRTGIGTSTTVTFTTAENQKIITELNKDTTYWTQPTYIRMKTWSGSTLIADSGTSKYTGVVTSATATTITAPSSFDIGASVTYTLGSEKSTGFHYDLTVKLGTYTKTLQTKADLSSTAPMEEVWATLADETALMGALPTSNSGTATWTLTTYFDNAGVYTKVRSATTDTSTISIPTSKRNPTWTGGVTWKDSNTVTSTLTGNNQYIIQSNSTLLATLTTLATAQLGTAINRYEVTVNGYTKPLVTTTVPKDFPVVIASELNTASNISMVVKAIDNRGNMTQFTKTVLVVPYQPPTLVGTVLRTNGFEDTTTITLSGSISPVNVLGANKNAIKAGIAGKAYEYKLTSASAYPTTGAGMKTVILTPTQPAFPAYTGTNTVITLDKLNAYTVKISVSDALQTVTKEFKVPVGQPIMFMDTTKKSIGVNKFPVNNGAFEVAGGLEADYLKINSTGDTSATSTNVGIMIGDNISANLKVDVNEVSAFNNGVPTGLHLNPDGGTIYFWNNALDHGNIVFENGGIRTQNPIAPSLQNGWVNYSLAGGTYAQAGYFKDAFGIVHLDGLIKNGTTTADTLIFTLPLGYRPVGSAIFVQHSDNTAKQVRIDVSGTGAVNLRELAGSWVSLAGITFKAG